MKKAIVFVLIFILLMQTCVAGALEYKPVFSYNGANDGRVIKSDFTLWEFEYNDKNDCVEAEKIDDDVIDIESNGSFRIKKDNSLWLHKFGHTPTKIMDNVKSICSSFATSQDYGYYVIKTDGSLWAWGSGRAAVPGTKTLYRDGERVDISHEEAVKIADNVTYVYGSNGVVFYIKDDYTLWAFGEGYFPYHDERITIGEPQMLLENVRYIDYWHIIKTDDSLWSWGYGVYKADGEIDNDFTSQPVKVMDNVRTAHTQGGWIGVAIKNDNTLWAWGRLGDPDSYFKYYWPIAHTQNWQYQPVMLGTDIRDFYSYAGNYILKTDGSLWGYGLDFTNGVSEPVKLMQVMSVVIDGENLVPVNEETELTATYYDKSGNHYGDPNMSWYCDDHSVLQLIPRGNTVTVKGLKPGKTVVSAVHNSTGEMASFTVTVDNYNISLEDAYYFQKETKSELKYDITFANKKIPLSGLNIAWRTENKDGEPLKNFTSKNINSDIGSLSFDCADDGECVLIASINGNDVKKIHVKVIGNLYELIEKETMARARMLSDSERFRYYRDTYVSAPRHITNLLGKNLMKNNNRLNNLFETGFSMKSFYTIVLWDLLLSKEYADSSSGYEETVFDSATEYVNNIGAENIMTVAEVTRDKEFSKLTKNSVLDFSSIIEGYGLYTDTVDDFEDTCAELTTFLTVSAEKIKIIEAIMQTSTDKNMRKACQQIIDTYQDVIDNNKLDILRHLATGTLKSTARFLLEEVTGQILEKMGLGVVTIVGDTVNYVLNTDDISRKAVLLMAYTDIEDVMKVCSKKAQADFETNPSYDTAMTFINLADSYKALLMYECDTVEAYIGAVETGDNNYSQIIFGDITPDRSLRPFGASNDYNAFKNEVRQTKETINKQDFYLGDMIDIAAYISDVRSTVPSQWAAKEIEEAFEKDILPEYMRFNYTEKITRAEFCTLLTNLVEKKSGKTIDELIDEKGTWIKSPFDDTCYKYVDYMYKMGVVSGTGGNCFSPLETITREEAATMLTRAAAALGYDTDATALVEETVSDWAKQGVRYVIQKEIMGDTGNGFDPKAGYSKEQAIITCLRMFNRL